MSTISESRRKFIKSSAAAFAGIAIVPGMGFTGRMATAPMRRSFGKLGVEVTTLGLGGQASLQWTPEDVDPVRIILKAFSKGINYFDTSNLYGPSQMNYGKAFASLDLIPSRTGYNEGLRRSIFLTTKTHLRSAKGGDSLQGVNSFTNGDRASKTVDDIKRSLSQMFGDGNGNYPDGAYLDMVLIHNLNTLQEVDALYDGLFDTDPGAEHIGALAALRDYRDGTNLTGLNPGEEKLIRHIGFSGHYSPPVMMEMIQRDRDNLLDAMLVAINANDKVHFNMQHNVIPVAAAKNMGLIAMKVFADGAMYSKNAGWTRDSSEVVRTVGSAETPSRPLIQYSLTTPGIHTAIIGIGQIDDDPERCQLDQNFEAAQVNANDLSETDRTGVEKLTNPIKDGKTNYFQMSETGLSAPVSLQASQEMRNEERNVILNWNSAYAGDQPLKNYEIWRDGQRIGVVEHRPQTTKTPFQYIDQVTDRQSHEYDVVITDMAGRNAKSESVRLPVI